MTRTCGCMHVLEKRLQVLASADRPFARICGLRWVDLADEEVAERLGS